MEPSIKIVILKLQQPLTQLPEMAALLKGFQRVIRIPDSVFIIQTSLAAGDLCDKLAAAAGDRGSVFVGALDKPSKMHGDDVSLTQLMSLFDPQKT